MWAYRTLHACFALHRDEAYFERRQLIESLPAAEFTVLNQLDAIQWTSEQTVIEHVVRFGQMKGALSARQIVAALFSLVSKGHAVREFIPTQRRKKRRKSAPKPNPEPPKAD